MMNRHLDMPPRRAATIAGSGYLVIFMLAIFANFFVRNRLVEPGDAAVTAGNILGSQALFRLGLVSFLVVFALDVAVAWALYVFFRRVGRDVSLLAAWFRLVYTTLLGVGLIFLFLVLQLVSGDGFSSAFRSGRLDSQLLLFLQGFDAAWLIGLLCFGVHLVLLGALAIRSGFMPRILGMLLIVAGGAYITDTLAHALLASYDDHQTLFLAIVAIPSVIGEFSLAVWLLLRGGKERDASPSFPQRRDAALEAREG